MSQPTWDPTAIVLTFKGYEISGFAEGTYITAARAEDTWSVNVGAQGDVVRVLSKNQSGTIVVTLQMSSFSNGVLSQILKSDEQNLDGVGDVMLKDLRGNTLIHGENAWIMKPSDAAFAKDLESREWTIMVGRIEMNLDGF